LCFERPLHPDGESSKNCLSPASTGARKIPASEFQQVKQRLDEFMAKHLIFKEFMDDRKTVQGWEEREESVCPQAGTRTRAQGVTRKRLRLPVDLR
jgi:hypothetical protein